MRGQWLEDIGSDVKVALRQLRSSPAFTMTSVLALGLGIGAATTIFSVIKNVLLDPYPMYRQVDRIVGVLIHDVNSARPGGRDSYQTAEFLEYQAQARSFEDVIAGSLEPALFTSGEGTEEYVGGLVSANTFSFMGVSAAIGRTIVPDDAKPGAPPVFVMSYKTWANRFGLDPSIVGRTFVWNDRPRTLVGIMPARVSKLGADVWRPVQLEASDPQLAPMFFKFQARLKPGVTIEQAQSEMTVLAQRLAKTYSRNYPPKFSVQVVGLIDSVVGGFRRTLYTMAAAVALLLLIACANVANMLLSRAAGREREMALRAALGASRRRLLRQLLVESLVLALLGVVVGWLFAQLGITLVVGAIPEGIIPRESLIRLDSRVLAFSLAVAALTAIAFGLAPALRSSTPDLIEPLRDAGKGTGGGFRRRRLSSALVVGEIALSLVLLTCAGLLMRSFVKLEGTDLGFKPDNLLFVRLSLGRSAFKSIEAQQQLLSQSLARIRSLPGVVGAATTTGLPPFGGIGITYDVPGIAHSDQWRGDLELCSEDYFRTLGIPLQTGRTFSADDTTAARAVAIVNRTLVERHFRDTDPIGREVSITMRIPGGTLENRTFQIVGVVRDVRNQGPTDPVAPEIFVPSSSVPLGMRGIVVRTRVPPGTVASAVKQEIWAVNRGVAIAEEGTLTDYLARYVYAEPRLGLFVFGAFAWIGLVLVIVGVYGLIAYTVARQTREIGIRIAIGASRRNILRMTLGLTVRWIAVGVAIGLGVSFAATRVLASQLRDVSPTDPLTIGAVVAVVVVAGLTAGLVPALRATRVDPMIVLRYE